MNRLKSENYLLKQNNYYLVCTIQQLEKQKLKIVNQDIDEISEIILEDTREYDSLHNQIMDISCNNYSSETLEIPLLENQLKEILLLKTELQETKMEIEVQKNTLENKIIELEKQKEELEMKLKLEQSENKDEIERLNKENDILYNNNAQLQFELIKILKNKQKIILEN
jgi:hypothetical protein